MAIHPRTIEWHDLIEDPDDLPLNDIYCQVTIYDPSYKNFIHAERKGIYRYSKRCWEIYVDAEDVNSIPKFISLDDEGGVRVIAWAECPLIFVPESNALEVMQRLKRGRLNALHS